jgi:hypothetical protein
MKVTMVVTDLIDKKYESRDMCRLEAVSHPLSYVLCGYLNGKDLPKVYEDGRHGLVCSVEVSRAVIIAARRFLLKHPDNPIKLEFFDHVFCQKGKIREYTRSRPKL